MAQQVQFRRGTTTEISTFTGVEGEVVFNTTLKTLVLCDGVLAGGYPLPYLVSGKIPTSLIGDATTSVKGLVELATQAEVTEGTSTTLVVTPSSLPTAVRSYLNASGSAPVYACRAWVNFNGTTSAIRASGNVSSVTDDGGGAYTVNFTVSMQDANYCVNSVGSARGESTALAPVDGFQFINSVRVRANYGGDNTVGSYSPVISCVSIFR